jgi:hypothetical protein
MIASFTKIRPKMVLCGGNIEAESRRAEEDWPVKTGIARRRVPKRGSRRAKFSRHRDGGA